MGRHFPIKSGQPIEMALVILNLVTEFRNKGKEPAWNGMANFGQNIPTEICGPPPEVIPNIPVRRNRNEPFHLNSDRNFRNLWHNGKHLRSIHQGSSVLGILIIEIRRSIDTLYICKSIFSLYLV